MNGPKRDGIATALAAWITFLLVFSWLPLVRVIMDGDSYRWATDHFGIVFAARGWEADAWLLVFKTATLIGLLWIVRRGTTPASRWVVAAVGALFSADALHKALTNPGGFEFHGDTLGIHLDLGWPVILVTLGFAALAVAWALRGAKPRWSRPTTRWTGENSKRIAMLAATLPVVFVLLRFGQPHGATDAAGVLITIALCPLLAWALAPRSSRR